MNKMFRMSRNFLTVGNDLYEVLRIHDENRVKDTEEYKKFIGADRVFRKDGRLLFCVLVEEAQIIEETFDKDDKGHV